MSVSSPFGGGAFIADNSAWQVIRRAPSQAQEEWAAALRAGQILDNTVVRLELLYSTRNRAEFEAWEAKLSALRSVPITASICAAALTAQRELAARSDCYHRVKLPDLLIAASAQERAVGVLHYDQHFARLAEVMAFEPRWVVARDSV